MGHLVVLVVVVVARMALPHQEDLEHLARGNREGQAFQDLEHHALVEAEGDTLLQGSMLLLTKVAMVDLELQVQ
jgi:hypothetical protein